MGCLFAVIGGIPPRFAFFVWWIMRPAQVDAAFDTFIFPLLGIIFLPLATLLYAVLRTVGGLSGWRGSGSSSPRCATSPTPRAPPPTASDSARSSTRWAKAEPGIAAGQGNLGRAPTPTLWRWRRDV